MYDDRLLSMLGCLSALRDLSEEDKKSLKDLRYDWSDIFVDYKPDFEDSNIGAVISFYNSLVREYPKNNYVNIILIQAINALLAEKSKE